MGLPEAWNDQLKRAYYRTGIVEVDRLIMIVFGRDILCCTSKLTTQKQPHHGDLSFSHHQLTATCILLKILYSEF
jgi:hypothetical protein